MNVPPTPVYMHAREILHKLLAACFLVLLLLRLASVFNNLDGLGAMKLKHFESALQPVTKYSDLGTDHVNIDLEQYR